MRSSAWHPRQLGPQTGRTLVVTGANSGIGLEVTRDLVRRGAHVVMAVRDTARGAATASQLDGPGTTTVLRFRLRRGGRVRVEPLLLPDEGGSVVTPDGRSSVVTHQRRNPAKAGFPGADDGIRTRDLHLGKVAL
jgi:NAD(P)-dependent dehydrogenase (short-subunit alcohol dehydrogenase family)